MSINWNTVKSVSWITAATSAILLLIKVILQAFGVDFETESISTAINVILGLLAGAGVLTGSGAATTIKVQGIQAKVSALEAKVNDGSKLK